MKYYDSKKNEILNIDDWKDKVFSNTKKEKHWKVGRSAHSIADFMMNRDGEKYLSELISKLISEKVEFEKAIPELEIRFDKFGRGREHDLGIFGRTTSGKSVFIGIESKVDESFNERLSEVYLQAKAKQLSGVTTNAPQRIENLIKLNFPNITQEIFNLRYQLLYTTAGTVAEGADISILLIIVFKTDLYDAKKGMNNYDDYKQFIETTNSSKTELGDGIDSYKIKLGDKVLYSIYLNL